jgi:prevent-host-death family protein
VSQSISAKQLRASLPEVVRRVRKGARFTVLYRSRPAFQIVPVGHSGDETVPLAEDSLYGAPAVGRSRDRATAADHDTLLYRK